MTDIPLKFRSMTDGDVPFLVSTWIQSAFRNGLAAHVSNEIYYRRQRALVLRLLATDSVLVACDPEAPDVVFGWVCYRPGVLHHVVTKAAFKGLGIGRQLLERAGFGSGDIVCSHWTNAMRRFRRTCIFDPYTLLEVTDATNQASQASPARLVPEQPRA